MLLTTGRGAGETLDAWEVARRKRTIRHARYRFGFCLTGVCKAPDDVVS